MTASSFLHASGLIAALALAAPANAAPRAVSLVVTNGTVVTVDGAHRVIADGALAIEGGAIVAVGPRAEISAGRSSTPAAASSSPAWSTPTATRRWCCSAAWPTT